MNQQNKKTSFQLINNSVPNKIIFVQSASLNHCHFPNSKWIKERFRFELALEYWYFCFLKMIF
ncbi:MAG TPA: hypothetical protein DCG69_09620 [Bacteroidales bacterium]|nr:hypothetical protein [Bacteroidales bacterium]